MSTKSNKPLVQYVGEAEFFFDTMGNERAVVYGLDHPLLGNQFIRTSRVLGKQADGSFETLNTFYERTYDKELALPAA